LIILFLFYYTFNIILLKQITIGQNNHLSIILIMLIEKHMTPLAFLDLIQQFQQSINNLKIINIDLLKDNNYFSYT